MIYIYPGSPRPNKERSLGWSKWRIPYYQWAKFSFLTSWVYIQESMCQHKQYEEGPKYKNIKIVSPTVQHSILFKLFIFVWYLYHHLAHFMNPSTSKRLLRRCLGSRNQPKTPNFTRCLEEFGCRGIVSHYNLHNDIHTIPPDLYSVAAPSPGIGECANGMRPSWWQRLLQPHFWSAQQPIVSVRAHNSTG